jgi:hypothetical protein
MPNKIIPWYDLIGAYTQHSLSMYAHMTYDLSIYVRTYVAPAALSPYPSIYTHHPREQPFLFFIAAPSVFCLKTSFLPSVGLRLFFFFVPWQVGGAAHVVFGLLYPRQLKNTYHTAGGGCRNRACEVRSWGFEEAGLDLENRWKNGPFAHTCASVVGVSVGPSVVGRDWSLLSSNKARGCCCRIPGDH